MQYIGMEVITCGRGAQSSRVPPDFYCHLPQLLKSYCQCSGCKLPECTRGERQLEKVHAMCDQESFRHLTSSDCS